MDREFTINELRVMAERHFGAERATASQLGKIFGVPYQTIHALMRRMWCRKCGRPVCGHTDLEYQGIA